MQTGNYTYDPLTDMPADFGPEISPDGVQGLLVIADPEDACLPVSGPAIGPDQEWVALIVRSEAQQTNCSFDVKVKNAEDAGASAAIIYDDKYEALIIMSKRADHPAPGIPAVFINQNSGLILKKLLTPGVSMVTITPTTDAVWMSMLLSASAGMLAVTVVVGTFYFIRWCCCCCCRSRRQRIQSLPGRLGYALMRGAEEGMTPAELRALPIVIHEAHGAHAHSSGDEDQSYAGSDSDDGSPLGPKGGGTIKTCAICIEDYRDGNKLRVLPCKHRFHIECIDQWLSSRKPLCPICKWEATQPFMAVDLPPEAMEQAQRDAAAAATSARPSFWSLMRWPRRSRPQPPSAQQEPLLASTASAALASADEDELLVARPASQGQLRSVSASLIPDDSPELASTPSNFPGMHSVPRRGPSLSQVVGGSREIEVAEDVQPDAEAQPCSSQRGARSARQTGSRQSRHR